MALPLLEKVLIDAAAGPLPTVRDARNTWANYRQAHGRKRLAPNLLAPPKANSKLVKSKVPTWGLVFAPHESSGLVNVCPWATALCIAACVMVTAGLNILPSAVAGKVLLTRFAAEHPAAFLTLLRHELTLLNKRGHRVGVRLNVAGDVRWERILDLSVYTNITFYDYTKAPERGRRNLPSNYTLTYSVHERWTDERIVRYALDGNVPAVVLNIRKHDVPATYLGLRTIDGDLSDYRPDDVRGGTVVVLAAKGDAIHQDGGFVRQPA